MERIVVTGGAVLEGEVEVPGAKNSVLKLMAASLLAEGRTVLHDVPGIVDVRIMAELLRRLGCVVEHDAAARTCAIDVPAEVGHRADYELVRAMRASISVLGPLTARVGRADVAVPGGDAIGSRGLDLHVEGLRAMGADVHVDHGYLVTEAPAGGLRGAEVALAFPSVGATENLLMAAVLARGRTVLSGVAREPEIDDLVDLLLAMGARITGRGGSELVVDGVDALSPAEHAVVPDRVVAGTWAYAAAITGGRVHVRGARPEHLVMALDKLREAGAEVEPTGTGLLVQGPERPRPVDVATLPYPGFPTDLQPFALALAAVADGSCVVTENLFEARFRFAHELERLGADLVVDGHHVLVRGRPGLSAAPVEASDIRAGAALVVAALRAEGTTAVHGVGHVDRGYEDVVASLRGLGADVRREVVEPAQALLPVD
ncbi:UDP-N-acetylglucosamine 1-carboxyvinyltransferase [uncultured Pseudokineococcus sp.]|uniref:UDP-N-acetylglucosamine 1-carboxyvinyltransferase n=1 Tax=uncultured Pseudokineococcus sp. TaxID=1642928 RepID=UPI0026144D26|nr:UDP-N-acetylglucosamine 1-carboxyvinyltransferase [uncultured Pseudokineococcus sp.]